MTETPNAILAAAAALPAGTWTNEQARIAMLAETIKTAPTWAEQGFALMLAARNTAPAGEESERIEQAARAFEQGIVAICEKISADLDATLEEQEAVAHGVLDSMNRRSAELAEAFRALPVTIDMAIAWSTDWAEQAFLAMEGARAAAPPLDACAWADEAARIIVQDMRTTTARMVADLQAIGATPDQIQHLARGREAVFAERVRELLPSIGLGLGTA